MVADLHLYGGSNALAGFDTMGDKTHGLIHNGGTHTAMEGSCHIAHPQLCAATQSVLSPVGIAADQVKLHQITNGAGDHIRDQLNSLFYDLFQIFLFFHLIIHRCSA